NGDNNFVQSSAVLNGQTVLQASTTTAQVGSSLGAAVFGQAVTFTTTISAQAPGAGTPTGTVAFMDGNNALGTGTLSSGKATFTVDATQTAVAVDSNGTATLSVSSLTTGAHKVSASYSGDPSFNSSSTASAVTQTVVQAGSTTTLSTSPLVSVFGQTVTLT